jgi:hypothetical protein
MDLRGSPFPSAAVEIVGRVASVAPSRNDGHSSLKGDTMTSDISTAQKSSPIAATAAPDQSSPSLLRTSHSTEEASSAGWCSPSTARSRPTTRCGSARCRRVRRVGHCWIELACGGDRAQVPFKDALRGRITPGSSLEHPPVILAAAQEEQTGIEVQAGETGAARTVPELRVKVRIEIERSRETYDVLIGHPRRERDGE